MEEYVEVFAASDIKFAYLMKANLENTGMELAAYQIKIRFSPQPFGQ